MTWFFAILIVLVLGGIAALAAGRGAPMVEVDDDRPPSGVPDDGPLGADDLRRVRFPIALRGYRMSDVDALLDRLAAERDAEAGAEAGADDRPDDRGAPGEGAPGVAVEPGRGEQPLS